jgi:hypothetical protein
MSDKTGGPAFPATNHYGHKLEGMTLRDYFAAKAMQGLISCPEWLDGAGEEVDVPNCMASAAYAMADAMLKARGQ